MKNFIKVIDAYDIEKVINIDFIQSLYKDEDYTNLKKLPLAEYFAALPKAERRPVIISAPKEDVITAIVEASRFDCSN